MIFDKRNFDELKIFEGAASPERSNYKDSKHST